MSNNAGVPNRTREAKEDALAVAALRAQGAIPLLVSNTPELCLCWETYNPVTGRTNNPYNPRYTSAGSSGGEVLLQHSFTVDLKICKLSRGSKLQLLSVTDLKIPSLGHRGQLVRVKYLNE